MFSQRSIFIAGANGTNNVHMRTRLRMLASCCSELAMAGEQGQSEAAAYKAVERVLTGAVSKILSVWQQAGPGKYQSAEFATFFFSG